MRLRNRPSRRDLEGQGIAGRDEMSGEVSTDCTRCNGTGCLPQGAGSCIMDAIGWLILLGILLGVLAGLVSPIYHLVTYLGFSSSSVKYIVGTAGAILAWILLSFSEVDKLRYRLLFGPQCPDCGGTGKQRTETTQ